MDESTPKELNELGQTLLRFGLLGVAVVLGGLFYIKVILKNNQSQKVMGISMTPTGPDLSNLMPVPGDLPTSEPTIQPTNTQSAGPPLIQNDSITFVPTATLQPTVAATQTPAPTNTLTPAPSETPTPLPLTPTPTESLKPTETSTPSASLTPSATISPKPTS